MTGGWPPVLDRGVAALTHQGEARSGDVAVFAPCRRGGLLAVIDGLGHGDLAADAAEAAAEVVRAGAENDPHDMLDACHRALRATRGAVMTLAWFDVGARSLEWTGVGNVEARLVRAGTRPSSPVVLGGVLGMNLPRARLVTVALEAGDTVVLASDGVSADFSDSVDPAAGAQQVADHVLERCAKGTDDAIVAVVRVLGE
jgi:negative regulator of sigma-B (phosphoserine phosphatase)